MSCCWVFILSIPTVLLLHNRCPFSHHDRFSSSQGEVIIVFYSNTGQYTYVWSHPSQDLCYVMFFYFSFHQIDLVLDGNYYCSLKKSSVRAPFHLCDTLLISVVLWTCKYFIHISTTTTFTLCSCKLYLSQVLCGLLVFWIMFPWEKGWIQNSCLQISLSPQGEEKKLRWRHEIQSHVYFVAITGEISCLHV